MQYDYRKITRFGVLIMAAIITFISAVPVFANWSAPLAGPPNCTTGNPGCDQPVNISGTPQTKLGEFNATISTNGIWAIQGTGAQYGVYGNGSLYGLDGVSSGGIGVAGTGGTWGGNFSGQYGVYGVDTSGYYGELGNAGYSLYGNGNIYVSGNIQSGQAIYAPNSFGGIWTAYSNGVCAWGNALTGGGCSCPAYASVARFEGEAASNLGGGWQNMFYYCTE